MPEIPTWHEALQRAGQTPISTEKKIPMTGKLKLPIEIHHSQCCHRTMREGAPKGMRHRSFSQRCSH